ncbi:MAG: DUF1295 domain-containing protein [Pseudomonadota bacterium]
MTTHVESNLRRDFTWILVAYATAICVGAAVYIGCTRMGEGPVLAMLYADIAGTLAIFAFSQMFSNTSFYDAYWSVAPPLIFLGWLATAPALDLRSVLVFVLVCLWAVRLTHNWGRGWMGLGHVDWRYVDLRVKTGRAYPLVDLAGLHMFPTLIVFTGCIPLLRIAHLQAPLGGLDAVWLAVGFGALYLEWRADNVLRAHRLQRERDTDVLREDVWAWCRHPNYVGEMGFWLALAIAGHILFADVWNWLGFVLMVLLFVCISIPMIDKRQLANKPDYARYKAEVPTLIPRLKRSPGA